MKHAALVVTAVIFAGGGIVFFTLAHRWSHRLAEIAPYTPHTDGLQLSIFLAVIAGFLLLSGGVVAGGAAFTLRRKPGQ